MIKKERCAQKGPPILAGFFSGAITDRAYLSVSSADARLSKMIFGVEISSELLANYRTLYRE